MPPTARSVAVHALIPAAERFPDLPLSEPDLSGLSGADAALATAIHRTVLQRWLTLDHLLARQLKSPLRKLDATTYAVLLTAAAQLVFLDRLPAYAVIDESVKLAKRLSNPRSAGLVNAVLRKLAETVEGRGQGPWVPGVDRLPIAGDGGGRGAEAIAGVVRLRGGVRGGGLPRPDNLLAHLVVATSHPLPLLQRWFKLFGRERATALALHSLVNPPTFVVEDESPRVWDGSREELSDWLAADPARRVQDPASLASVAAAADLDPVPRTILDLCAGRGTKTRQLRALFPDAKVTAWDPDDDRRADLHRLQAANLTVAEPAPGQAFDLILLDVPCSNTGVLARRPGARYRATDANLRSLLQLQRRIIDRALDHLAPGGRILYCTCSIEPQENQQQAKYLLEQRPGSVVLKEAAILPRSAAEDAPVADTASALPPVSIGGDYHDGSYHALIQTPVTPHQA